MIFLNWQTRTIECFNRWTAEEHRQREHVRQLKTIQLELLNDFLSTPH